MTALSKYPQTPDGRYFVSKGKLWRKSNPNLTPKGLKALNKKLMEARRGLKLAGHDTQKMRTARRRVHAAKVALGERGPVWWSDDAPDENNIAPRHTAYAEWWESLSQDARTPGQV